MRRAVGTSCVVIVIVVVASPAFAANWPGWRGDGSGVSVEKGLPVEWNSEKNVLWKTRIEGSGHSSPIVWGNGVFLTTAVKRSRPGLPPWVVPVLETGALLLVLLCFRLGRKRRTEVGPKRPVFSTACKIDRLGTVLAVFLFFAGLAYVCAEKDLVEPGAEQLALKWTGAVGILGIAAAASLLDVRSRCRLLVAAAMIVAVVLYVFNAPTGIGKPKALILLGGALSVWAWWCVLLFASPPGTAGDKRSRGGRAWYVAAPAAVLLIAGLQFVSINYFARRGEWARLVVCVDGNSGSILWQREGLRTAQLNKHVLNSYATPTPVTDGNCVVADFGPGLVCMDLQGRVKWHKSVAEHSRYSYCGAASSPVIFEDSVIFAIVPDGPSPRSNDALARYSWLTAVDKETGRVKWQVRLPGGHDSYDTPLICRAGDRPVLLIVTWEHVVAYDPASGARLWSLNVPIRQCIPSVVAGDNRAYLTSGRDHGSEGAIAVDLVDQGGHTRPRIVWQLRRSTAEIPSPVLYDGLLYMVTKAGIATCVDAETGKVVWKKRVGGRHYASLVAGDGKVYFTAASGEITVIRAGREYRELARNAVGEQTVASPAISSAKLFVRGKEHLFCIAATE